MKKKGRLMINLEQRVSDRRMPEAVGVVIII